MITIEIPADAATQLHAAHRAVIAALGDTSGSGADYQRRIAAAERQMSIACEHIALALTGGVGAAFRAACFHYLDRARAGEHEADLREIAMPAEGGAR